MGQPHRLSSRSHTPLESRAGAINGASVFRPEATSMSMPGGMRATLMIEDSAHWRRTITCPCCQAWIAQGWFIHLNGRPKGPAVATCMLPAVGGVRGCEDSGSTYRGLRPSGWGRAWMGGPPSWEPQLQAPSTVALSYRRPRRSRPSADWSSSPGPDQPRIRSVPVADPLRTPVGRVGRSPKLMGGPTDPATRETLHCCRGA
jgi:hypothetical protein